MKSTPLNIRSDKRNLKFGDTSCANHKVGDIVLTKSKKGYFLTGGQKILGRLDAKYSHVLICITNGIFVEATMGEKVNVFYYKDESNSLNDCTKWVVMRHPALEENTDMAMRAIIDSLVYQHQKPYGIDIKTKGLNAERVICSNLVLLICKEINKILGKEIFEFDGDNAFPADFQKLKGYIAVNHDDMLNESFNSEFSSEDRLEMVASIKNLISERVETSNNRFNEVIENPSVKNTILTTSFSESADEPYDDKGYLEDWEIIEYFHMPYMVLFEYTNNHYDEYVQQHYKQKEVMPEIEKHESYRNKALLESIQTKINAAEKFSDYLVSINDIDDQEYRDKQKDNLPNTQSLNKLKATFVKLKIDVQSGFYKPKKDIIKIIDTLLSCTRK